ncbi:MAG TPA: ABC transporter ATP-binding protein [Oscillospiraceae bacterium]|nr:ABC transporter ATP-binding protein [Oscillospiraceae bacterium]HPK34811.1 ABC transporter ATP-binding protein [Oscillospiraceae bacterium]HPR75861.1 ABC transporter ATP-binding protein [Oscillospiraceae bacterium]
MARNRYDIDETLDTKFSFKHLKRAGVYIKKYKWKLIITLIASFISSAAALFTVTLSGSIIDKAIPNKDVKLIFIYGGILVACILVSIVLSIVRMRMMAILGQSIIFDIRNDLYQHMQELSFSYFDSRPHGKILVRIINYINALANVLTNGVVTFILDMFNILIILVFMFMKDVTLSLYSLAGVPLFILIAFLMRPKQVRVWRRFSNKSSNLTAFFAENINGMKVTQIFAREEYNRGICDRLAKNVKQSWVKAVMAGQIMNFSVDTVANAVTCLIYAAGVMILAPSATVGTIVVMTGYAGQFWTPILSLAVVLNNFMTAVAYLERIFEMMDAKPEISDCEHAETLPPIKGEVEFKDVHFEYEKGIEILHGVSFKIKPGESVALVGPTGSGKSTIVNLISRFYDIKSGQVLIDGHDISKVTMKSLRSQMGIMMQDSFAFSGTIASNIRYGLLDATDEQVQNAAKTVSAHHFILQQPKGYETEIAERASGLSQGQKQLIAFARTIVSDPKILILDEATSSIDTKTEQALQKGIAAVLKGRTSFLIAHRLSTIRDCDRIMYIDGGKIIESGNHEELMAKRGAYYRLVTAGHQTVDA